MQESAANFLNSTRLLDRVRIACRVRHYSPRTVDVYHHWIKRFILFHNKRHPQEMAAAEINAFLTHLAVERHVSASTQNQAFSALLFLYQKVLEVEPGRIEGAIRAVRPKRLPVVLSQDEVRRIIAQLDGVYRLIALIQYGAGLRLLECLRLRVKDLDPATMSLSSAMARAGKIGGPCFPRRSNPSCASMCAEFANNIGAIWTVGTGQRPCRRHSVGKRPRPAANSAGNSSFQPRQSASTPTRANASAGTCTNRRSPAPTPRRCVARASASGPRVMPSGIRSPRICWMAAMIFEPCKSSWATRMSKRPWSTPTC